MKIFTRDELAKETLPGRQIQKGVGKDALSKSGRITMGFARFSEEYGVTEPHHHAEEVCYVLDAKDGWIRFGPSENQLGHPKKLEKGMTIHIPSLEWHVFGYDAGGYVEVIFIYGQVDNIRPEEIDT